MFGKFLNKNKELQKQIHELQWTEYRLRNRVDELERDATHREATIKMLQEYRSSEAANSDMQVDFERMRAFSIERLVDDKGVPHTVIGYVLRVSPEDQQIKEWKLECNQQTHDRLVAEFRNTMKKGEK